MKLGYTYVLDITLGNQTVVATEHKGRIIYDSIGTKTTWLRLSDKELYNWATEALEHWNLKETWKILIHRT